MYGGLYGDPQWAETPNTVELLSQHASRLAPVIPHRATVRCLRCQAVLFEVAVVMAKQPTGLSEVRKTRSTLAKLEAVPAAGEQGPLCRATHSKLQVLCVMLRCLREVSPCSGDKVLGSDASLGGRNTRLCSTCCQRCNRRRPNLSFCPARGGT